MDSASKCYRVEYDISCTLLFPNFVNVSALKLWDNLFGGAVKISWGRFSESLFWGIYPSSRNEKLC